MNKLMKNDIELLAHLWLDGDNSVSISLRKFLESEFGDAIQIFEKSDDILRECLQEKFSAQDIDYLLERKRKAYLDELVEQLNARNIFVLYPGMKAYPEKLLQIYDPPRLLYAKGCLDERINYQNQSIAIVGSREADVYSTESARVFSRELARRGVNIISGLARGIDSQAHIGCLEVDGYTVAVLGSGINVPYPRGNIELYEQIAKKGLVLSEYGLNVAPMHFQFPVRNRIISGLSDGVLVACAKKKSGSLITADAALEQGKTVYAFPGRPMDENSKGNNHLIKMGACCVTEPEDILIDLWGDFDAYKEEQNKQDLMNVEDFCQKNALAPMEKIVYSLLGLDPIHIDEVIERSRIGVTNTISTLYELEQKGFIKQPMKCYYIWNL